MKKATIFELRDNLSAYLSEVAKTEKPLVVYKYKTPFVVIVPSRKELTEPDIKKFFGFLKKDVDGMTFENRIRRNKNEGQYVRQLRKGL